MGTEAEKKLKVYQMNDYDWWADYSLEEAKVNYIKSGDFNDDYTDDAFELNDEDLKALTLTDTESNLSLGKDKITFAEYLQTLTEPQFFATTEY